MCRSVGRARTPAGFLRINISPRVPCIARRGGTAIAVHLDCRLRPTSSSHIWNYVFEAPMYAAHLLRNHEGGGIPRERDQ
jgi:hypothetical protein